MSFTTPLPSPPPPLPANVMRIDPATGLPSPEWAEYEARFAQWIRDLQTWLAALAAAVP